MKNFKKTLALALAAAVSVSTVFVASPAEAQAAAKKNTVSVTLKAKAATTKKTLKGKGQTLTITSKYKGKKVTATKVKYSIDKKGKSFVSVSKKGVITTKAPGTATVTAKYTVKKKTYSAKVKVTVKKVATTKVTAKNVTVKMGNKKTKVTATVTPASATDAVTFTSSNKKVVKVDKTSGLLNPVKVGTAKVTVKSGKQSKKVTVTVGPKSLKISGNKNITVGDSIKLTATPSSKGGTIKWNTSDKKIATISKATGSTTTVKGVKSGTVKITASVNGTTKTVTIKVSAKTTPTVKEVTGVKFTSTAKEVTVGSTITVKAVAEPSDATTDKTITYSSKATNVATVNASTGVVTGISTGQAVIVATSKNGKTASVEVTVKAAVDGARTFDGVYYTYDLTSASKVSKGSRTSATPVVDLIKSDVDKLATKTNKAWTAASLAEDLNEIFAKSSNSALLKKADTSLFAAQVSATATVNTDKTVKVVIGTKTYDNLTIDDTNASVHKLTFTADKDTMTAEIARDASEITIKSGSDVVYSFKKTTTGYEVKIRKSAYDNVKALFATDFVASYTVSK